MSYKVFLTAFISIALLALPQNSFTCGPSEDPHDYYTSFFSNRIGTSKAYEPFYYTSLLKFYDDEEGLDNTAYKNNSIIKEWAGYTKTTEAATEAMVYKMSLADLLQLKQNMQGNKAIPKTLLTNAAIKNLVEDKKIDAVTYLAFAKEVESFIFINNWSDNKNDSLTIIKYINTANNAFATTTEVFLKNKWAFQRCKLAFYSNRYQDCIDWYNAYFTDGNTATVNQLALSYKAGSQYRLGQKKEAAYSFSKAFPLSAQNKKNNYLGFLWATNYANADLQKDYTSLCKNNPEKANMLALFALHGTGYKLETLQQVYALNPSSALLPLLATREINKLEENYFSPLLSKEKGGKALYVQWDWPDDTEQGKLHKDNAAQLTKTAIFFEQLLKDKSLPHRDVYGAGAAYLYFMQRAFDKAKIILAAVKEITVDTKVKDQIALLQLLVIANEAKTITPETEEQMLPAIKWLTEKAKTDYQYGLFCRNFFSQILAQRYEQQADRAKAALAYGMADMKFTVRGQYEYPYPPAIDFVHDEINTIDLLRLHAMITSPQTLAIKQFVQLAHFKNDDIIDMIGTSYLRDGNYVKSVEWLKKSSKPIELVESQYVYETNKETTVNVDPFFDYINDWQRLNKSLPQPYTKLSLAQKLLELRTKMQSPTADNKSKLYYQYANGLYNMSYYGNSWEAVAYSRSTTEWNNGNYKQDWQKEYYGVYKAKEYYEKAYNAAVDKEFKAACLFMMAKCLQRQILWPAYNYRNAAQAEKKQAEFEKNFKHSPLFSKFKTEFGHTKYYLYAYNHCSYLKDYVTKYGSGPSKTIKK